MVIAVGTWSWAFPSGSLEFYSDWMIDKWTLLLYLIDDHCVSSANVNWQSRETVVEIAVRRGRRSRVSVPHTSHRAPSSLLLARSDAARGMYESSAQAATLQQRMSKDLGSKMKWSRCLALVLVANIPNGYIVKVRKHTWQRAWGLRVHGTRDGPWVFNLVGFCSLH